MLRSKKAMKNTLEKSSKKVTKTKTVYDCVTCGACCCNPNDNRELSYIDYIEIESDDRILKKPNLLRRLVVLDNNLVPHMKLDRYQRCAALTGRLGQRVACGIYADRPASCHSFVAGSRRCKQYRRDRGIDVSQRGLASDSKRDLIVGKKRSGEDRHQIVRG